MYANQTQYYQPGAYGYGYVARPQAKNTQPLTPDQIARLRQNGNAFDMKVDQEDLWKAACTHKEKDGRSTLVQNADGSWTCTICHEKFFMCDSSPEQVQEAVDTIINMLQTSKTIYLDAPDVLISQYYQVIPLLKKFPSLWQHALDNFSKYEGFTGVAPMGQGYSGFAAMNNLLANPYAAYGAAPMGGMYAPQQPMGFYPQQPQQMPQQPMGFYPQQPVGYPAPMAPAPMMDPSANPMAYGMPTTPAPTMAPPVGAMPGTPATAPAQQAEVQQQQTFNV